MVVPPPQRTAYFSSARRPGVVLRVQTMRAPCGATSATHVAGGGGDAAEPAEQVERRALGGEDARAPGPGRWRGPSRPRRPRRRRRCSNPRWKDRAGGRRRAPPRARRCGRRARATTRACGRQVRRQDGVAGQVAGPAQILLQRPRGPGARRGAGRAEGEDAGAPPLTATAPRPRRAAACLGRLEAGRAVGRGGQEQPPLPGGIALRIVGAVVAAAALPPLQRRRRRPAGRPRGGSRASPDACGMGRGEAPQLGDGGEQARLVAHDADLLPHQPAHAPRSAPRRRARPDRSEAPPASRPRGVLPEPAGAASAGPPPPGRRTPAPPAASCWPAGWRRGHRWRRPRRRPRARAARCGRCRPPRRRPCGSARPGATGIGSGPRIEPVLLAELRRRSGSAPGTPPPPPRGRRGRRHRPAIDCCADRPRHHVARGELGVRVLASHEAAGPGR